VNPRREKEKGSKLANKPVTAEVATLTLTTKGERGHWTIRLLAKHPVATFQGLGGILLERTLKIDDAGLLGLPSPRFELVTVARRTSMPCRTMSWITGA
jgi:hypothetical protein